MEVRLIFEGKKKDDVFKVGTIEEIKEEIEFQCRRKKVKKCKFEIKGEAELRIPKKNELYCLFE